MTNVDNIILNSYKNLLQGLAEFLGEGFEILLYRINAESAELIASANHHDETNEKSSLAEVLSVPMDKLAELLCSRHSAYFSRNSAGEDFRSANILIQGPNSKNIGLLKISFSFNTPVYKLISTLISVPSSAGGLSCSFDSSSELLEQYIQQIQQEVRADDSILPSLKNKEIIRICNVQGIFKFKNAVADVANALKISKNTVYLHLKALEK